MVFEDGTELKNAIQSLDSDIMVNPGDGVWDVAVIAPGYKGKCRGRCRALLLPGDGERCDIESDMVITYGMSSKDTITLSSIDGDDCVVAVQRGFDTLEGFCVEPQEIMVERMGLVPEKTAAVAGTAILLGVEI